MFSKPHVATGALNYYRNLISISPYQKEITSETPISEKIPVWSPLGHKYIGMA